MAAHMIVKGGAFGVDDAWVGIERRRFGALGGIDLHAGFESFGFRRKESEVAFDRAVKQLTERSAELVDQRSDVGGQMSEVGDQRSDAGRQRSHDRNLKSAEP